MFDSLIRFLVKARAKMHNDIYEKIEQAEQRIMKNQLAELALGHKCSLINQISLANTKSGPITLKIADGDKLYLERLKSGNLCFVAPKENMASPPTFIITVPKSGTWMIEKIMRDLGLQSLGLFARSNNISNMGQIQLAEGLPYGAGHKQFMPYEIAATMVQPGQFMMSHLNFAAPVLWAHRNQPFLLSVRNLRTTFISFIRYVKKHECGGDYPSQESLTPQELAKFILTHVQSDDIIQHFRAAVRLKSHPNAHVIRFEEMTSSDKDAMWPSVNSIATVCQISPETVYAAVTKNIGMSTPTFTGKISELGNLWTQEVEDAFIARGLDVLGEQLGYPRYYSPE